MITAFDGAKRPSLTDAACGLRTHVVLGLPPGLSLGDRPGLVAAVRPWGTACLTGPCGHRGFDQQLRRVGETADEGNKKAPRVFDSFSPGEQICTVF